MKRLEAGSRTSALQRLSAASALTLAVALPAHAQFFTSSGANITAPVNLLPIAPGASVFDYTGNELYVGSTAPGSFSALAGALLRGNALAIGTDNTGNGSVLVSGPGTRAELIGTAGRLSVGSWGTGTLTVSAGAVVDASLNTAGCSGASCNSFVGNGAGSTGTLTVTGSGSEVRTVRNFIVGQTAVFTVPINGFNFGTLGGTTNAFVNVLDGAKLRTQFAVVGAGPNNAAATGAERGFGTVVVDGAGSEWIVRHNSIDNAAAGIQIGERVNGQGDVTIRNGGKLLVDGTGGPGPTDFINLGRGGRGTLTVTGLGSSLEMIGVNTVLQPGRGGAGAQGTFNLLAGATASMLYLNVGRDLATGTVLIDGPGTLLSQIGVGTANVESNGSPAFATIGRDGGNGQATVSGGARWLISDGGSDSRTSGDNPGMLLGRGVGSTGNLTITGAGSKVEIVSNSLGLAPGVPDNYNAFMAVGFDSGSTGQLTVSAGGKLLLTGNAVSTLTDQRATTLNIGGRTDTLPGQGSATVTGLGSEIIVSGSDALINVGRGSGSSGSLNILDKSRVATTTVIVGGVGAGTLNIDDATLALSGFRVNPAVGAGMTVGRGTGGVGAMNLSNGAQLTVENNVLAGGLAIGGDSFVSGGSGNVSLTGASSILFSGSVASNISVGRTGNGVLSVAGGSTVDVGSGSVLLARETGTGSVFLTGGSNLRASTVVVGSDGANTGTGMLNVKNSAVTAGTVEIGNLGSLSGDEGTINSNVVLRGVLSPDGASGRMFINGGLAATGGQLLLDVGANGPGFDIDQIVLTKGSTFDFTGVQVTFNFLAGTDPSAFLASGQFDLDNFLLSLDPATSALTGLSGEFAAGETWATVFANSTFDAQSGTFVVGALSLAADGSLTFSTAPIPEPETWALMFAGLAAISAAARRRANRTRTA